MARLLNFFQDILDAFKGLDFLGSLTLRLYLAPVFWVAGANKFATFEDTAAWFGNPDWGLGLPMPELMAGLATGAEMIGAILLLIGFAVRWVSIPLMTAMIVAIVSVHWENGWQAVADGMSPFASDKLGPMQLEDTSGAIERLNAARSLLQEHGNYEWLTGSGSFVISNNGIEWAVTYLIMLLALFFMGGGRFLSVDYWVARRFRTSKADS